ncbi:DUF2840 domain-containing protein [Sphingobium yanoikuyae]|uniref:DUF2840 domain-containing protein n=1 Tax=Sphingobium yanoikuyae TaxID=13690 RepID=UPI002432CFB9|nr:DUF2840 domain-containing protein [Sphingobium yanoikuyae]
MTHSPPGERAPKGAVRPLHTGMTEIELIWIEKRLEHWIRFGRIAGERIVSRKTRIVTFRPDAIIAFVRWSANDYGTIHSRIDIVRAVRTGEAYTTVPFVRPGGELLLSIQGWSKVQRALELIDAIEAADLDPCEVAPDHWRHAHNRLSSGEPVRAYTAERHQAWLKRKALGQ